MRHLLLAALLAGSAWTTAHAEPKTWEFAYRGFQVDTSHTEWDIYVPEVTTTTSGFRPDAALTGSFTGNDTDGNGIIELAELTALDINGTSFFGCGPDTAGNMVIFACQINRFTFAPNGQLDIDAGWYQADQDYRSASFQMVTGSSFHTELWGRYSHASATYQWTSDTRSSIPAVPEPASGAMAAAGLVALGLARRARRLISRQP